MARRATIEIEHRPCSRHGIPCDVPRHRRRQAHRHVPDPQLRRVPDRARRPSSARGSRPRSAGEHAAHPLRPLRHGLHNHIPLPPGPLHRCRLRHRGDDQGRVDQEGVPLRLRHRHGGPGEARTRAVALPPRPSGAQGHLPPRRRPRRGRDASRHLQGDTQRPDQRRVQDAHRPRDLLVRQRHLLHGRDRRPVHRQQGSPPAHDHPSRQPHQLPHVHRRCDPLRGEGASRAHSAHPPGDRLPRARARGAGEDGRGGHRDPHRRGRGPHDPRHGRWDRPRQGEDLRRAVDPRFRPQGRHRSPTYG